MSTLKEDIDFLKELKKYINTGRKPFDIKEALADMLEVSITMAQEIEELKTWKAEQEQKEIEKLIIDAGLEVSR
jgi:hypothetical protein